MILGVRACLSRSGITSRTRQTHTTTEPWVATTVRNRPTVVPRDVSSQTSLPPVPRPRRRSHPRSALAGLPGDGYQPAPPDVPPQGWPQLTARRVPRRCGTVRPDWRPRTPAPVDGSCPSFVRPQMPRILEATTRREPHHCSEAP